MLDQSTIVEINVLITRLKLKNVTVERGEHIYEFYVGPDGSVRHDIIDQHGRPVAPGGPNHMRPIHVMPRGGKM